MKIPSATARSRPPLQVEMTPMIDVVFLLWIFFLWTASFHVPEQLLPSRIQQPAMTLGNTSVTPSAEDDFESMVIRVAGSADTIRWSLNGRTYDSLEQLATTLSEVHTLRAESAVVIDPEAQVPLGYVIDAYDLTRRLGFQTVQLAAER